MCLCPGCVTLSDTCHTLHLESVPNLSGDLSNLYLINCVSFTLCSRRNECCGSVHMECAWLRVV